MSKNPVLPLFVKSLSGNDTVIGLIAAISPLAGILFSFPVGMLADRWGKKRLLLTAAFVFLLAPLLYLLVSNPYWLIPIRFFHGIATAILGPVASAFIVGAYPESKGEKLGLYSSATLIGRTLAPLLGGAIISAFLFLGGNLSYRAVYAAAFLLGIPVLVLTLTLKGSEREAVKQRREKADARRFREEPCRFCEKQTAVQHLARGDGNLLCIRLSGDLSSRPPVQPGRACLPDRTDLLPADSRHRADKAPVRKARGHGGPKDPDPVRHCLPGRCSSPPLPLFRGTIEIAVIGVLFGLAMSVSTVATSTYVADVAKQENLGASLGALSSIMDIGHSSGPFVAGVVITATTMAGGFLTAGVVCVISAILFAAFALGRQGQRP